MRSCDWSGLNTSESSQGSLSFIDMGKCVILFHISYSVTDIAFFSFFISKIYAFFFSQIEGKIKSGVDEMNNKFTDPKNGMNTKISNFETKMNNKLENGMNTKFLNFETKMNTKFTAVSDILLN